MGKRLAGGILIAIAVGGLVSAQPPYGGRTQHFGPLVTTELAPRPIPGKGVANPGNLRPEAGKLTGLKWHGSTWVEDGDNRRWHRVAGQPVFPLPEALGGWSLRMNDGRTYFYADNGQLFALCLPVQTQ